LTYPDRGAHALLRGLQDLLGHHGLEALLKPAGLKAWSGALQDSTARGVDFAEISALARALRELYGVRSGAGLARQAVRATFVHTWGAHGALAGFKDDQFRRLDLQRRLEIGGMAAARVFNELSGMGLECSGSEPGAIFTFQHCPFCIGVQGERGLCGGAAGWIEGILLLIGAAEQLIVEETSCAAAGDAHCQFTVSPRVVEA